MNFKPKKIRKYPSKKITISIPIIASVVVIILLSIGIVKALTSIDLTVFLEVAGEELQQDGYGHTNFLLLGTGGKEHEGGNLTDTIIVASLDAENSLVTMISIPRDLYVKDETIGNSRINEVYYNAKNHFGTSKEGMEYTKTKIEDIVGVPIHYWIQANFDGFKDLVDAIGGVDINVETAIYDPYYPQDGTFLYETFSLDAGEHHLDGETALKYARSRKTTSDFDRANRQQQLIYAIKEKALQTKVILSKEKITEILNSLKENIETNIKVKEILTLGAIAKDLSEDKISQRLIHDDPTQCGGFLYTPAREFYNGMFVLIPAGGFDFLHMYSDLNFNMPQIGHENAKIYILNGTKTGGVAGEAKQILKRFCFEVVKFGNAETQDIEKTTYYYKQKYDEDGDPIESRPFTLNFLQKVIPGTESTNIPKQYVESGDMANVDILLEIGTDYTNSENYLDDPFYSLPASKPSTPAKDPA